MLVMSLKATERRGLNAPLLNLAAYDINRILCRNNVVILDLVYLLDKARELLIGLDKHLLLRLLILTQEGLIRGRILVIIKLDGLVLLNRKLGCVNKNLGGRDGVSRRRNRRGRGRSKGCG